MEAIIVLGVTGAILGLILAFSAEFFHVEVDERITTVEEMLPGYNCGACGCPGCLGMAEKVVTNDINLKACRPAKEEDLLKIQEYMKNTPDENGNVVEVKM